MGWTNASSEKSGKSNYRVLFFHLSSLLLYSVSFYLPLIPSYRCQSRTWYGTCDRYRTLFNLVLVSRLITLASFSFRCRNRVASVFSRFSHFVCCFFFFYRFTALFIIKLGLTVYTLTIIHVSKPVNQRLTSLNWILEYDFSTRGFSFTFSSYSFLLVVCVADTQARSLSQHHFRSLRLDDVTNCESTPTFELLSPARPNIPHQLHVLLTLHGICVHSSSLLPYVRRNINHDC